jgi:MFS transporter, FHS family, L-fucose permease
VRTASDRVALAVVTSIFFMWGFITVLNDVLIPHLKSLFTLSYAQAMLVQFIFFGAYFAMSMPAGRVVERYGYRSAIVIGLAVTGVGALLFVPAARTVSYGVFLGAFFVLASGITLLQVAANPYASLLGDPRQASSRLTLAQALNSLGTMLAPLFGGALILGGVVLGAEQLASLSPADLAAYRESQADVVTGPYLAIAATLFVLAVAMRLFRLPALTAASGSASAHGFLDVLRLRHVRYGIVAIFVYVGAEVSIGSFLISYLSQPSIGNVSEADASHYVSMYWGGAMVGRFAGVALMSLFAPRRLLATFAVIAAALVATTMLTHGDVALWSIVAIGLFNSIMFPTIFTLAIEHLGPLTDKASSLLVMAIVGGAIVPLLEGALADRIGVQHAFVLPLVCYLFIVFYGLDGSRVDAASPAVVASPDVVPGS